MQIEKFKDCPNSRCLPHSPGQESVLKLRPGDEMKLTEREFVGLAEAFVESDGPPSAIVEATDSTLKCRPQLGPQLVRPVTLPPRCLPGTRGRSIVRRVALFTDAESSVGNRGCVSWCMFCASRGTKTFATSEVVRCGNVRSCATLHESTTLFNHNGVQGVAGSNPAVPIV